MKYLIAGLGNIGAAYLNTRHNMGFNVVDALALKLGATFESDRYGAVARCSWRGRQLIVLKPSTFMNLSGKAIRYWLDREKIDKENLMVVLDDIALPFGASRIRAKGSDGGHNGLKSIDQLTGGGNYARLRIGIGGDFPQGMQADFVLSELNSEERKALVPTVEQAVEAILSFTTDGIERTMNRYNKRTTAEGEPKSNPKAATVQSSLSDPNIAK